MVASSGGADLEARGGTAEEGRAEANPPATAPGRPSRALPPVERVRPGLWSIPVPLPYALPGYVLVYAFETDAGPYLVDAGWDTPDAYAALATGLAGIGTRIEDVQGVLVSHVHPDHYGLAGRIREASGAWVSLHPADAETIPLYELRRTDPGPGMLRRAGAPEELADPRYSLLNGLSGAEIPKPDVLMEDGARPEIPGWDLTAIWTPGHSPGHLCFWEGRYRLMLSGDHVLPGVIADLPVFDGEEHDPAGDFLAALERVGRYDAAEVLPAHQHRFTGLGDRVRQVRDVLDRRFAEVAKALADGAETAWEVAQRLDRRRAWADMSPTARRAAVGETFAHLRALARRGVVREQPGTVTRWSMVGGGEEKAGAAR